MCPEMTGTEGVVDFTLLAALHGRRYISSLSATFSNGRVRPAVYSLQKPFFKMLAEFANKRIHAHIMSHIYPTKVWDPNGLAAKGGNNISSVIMLLVRH